MRASWIRLVIVDCVAAALAASLIGCSAGSGVTGGDAAPAVDAPADTGSTPPVNGDLGVTDADRDILDGAPADSGPRSICNGQDRYTFAFVRLVAPGDTVPGSQVVWENGFAYVRIDGHCRYWAFGSSQGTSPLDEIRTGVLSAAQARQIESDLRFADWPILHGEYGKDVLHDARPDVLTDGQSAVVCWALCTAAAAPEMRDLYGRALDLLDRLSASGQPVTGPVRIAVQPSDYPMFPPSMIWSWPLQRAMSQFVTPNEIAAPGSSFLIEGADADALRALRRMERTAPAVQQGITFIPVREAGGPLHNLFLRDTLPFEDAKGLLYRKF